MHLGRLRANTQLDASPGKESKSILLPAVGNAINKPRQGYSTIPSFGSVLLASRVGQDTAGFTLCSRISIWENEIPLSSAAVHYT
jgi:hypothetical protein